MRTLKLIAIGIILFASSTIHAQISVNLNIGTAQTGVLLATLKLNITTYQMLKLIMMRATQFIYFGGGRWIRSRYLPNQYRNYDLYGGYK
jgi:hypothetical protein